MNISRKKVSNFWWTKIIISFLGDTPNQPFKFRTRNCVAINDDADGMWHISLCDNSVTYVLVAGTITVTNTGVAPSNTNNANKKVAFKNWAPYTDSISEINNAQIDNAEDINVIVPV